MENGGSVRVFLFIYFFLLGFFLFSKLQCVHIYIYIYICIYSQVSTVFYFTKPGRVGFEYQFFVKDMGLEFSTNILISGKSSSKIFLTETI